MALEVDEGAEFLLLISLLGQPSPASIWQLRGELLQRGVPAADAIWMPLDELYHFLNELAATATAREYSHFASMLDIGAVGGVALQNVLAHDEAAELWPRLLFGAFSEGLMVLAARQYVKAWEREMAAVYRAAAWNLYRALWQLSFELKPTLSGAERRAHLEKLLAPVDDDQVGGTAKAALIARLYQLLLLTRLRQLVPAG